MYAIRRFIALAALTASGISLGCVNAATGSQDRPARSPHATTLAPVKRTQAAIMADSLFWRIIHAGAYDSIPRTLTALKAAYLQNTADGLTASHIAFLHTWRVAERARIPTLSPAITDEAILANKYFRTANARATTYDPRTHGFAAVIEMVEADLDHDEPAWAAGLAHGREAIERWPEFNWFTMGYTLSTRSDTSALFREALEMQWKTIDACRRKRVNRTNPDAGPILDQGLDEPDPLKRRACYNSWIAPHNVEGFLLNMGDMVMRSGDWRTAQKVYALSRQSASYDRWPYREILEARIINAERDSLDYKRNATSMMLRSKFACMACHQSK